MKLVRWIVGVPVGVFFVGFAVANRGDVTVSFDPLPFAPDLPLYAVAAPRHVFLRYDDGDDAINIETLEGGRQLSDAHYEEQQHIVRSLAKPTNSRHFHRLEFAAICAR